MGCTLPMIAGESDIGDNGTLYACDTPLRLEATPAEGYHFVSWSDGNIDNPRYITLDEELTLTALFAVDETDPSALQESRATDAPSAPQKIIRNEQVYILRDGRMYTVLGQEVK